VLVLGYYPKSLPSPVFRIICPTSGRGEPQWGSSTENAKRWFSRPRFVRSRSTGSPCLVMHTWCLRRQPRANIFFVFAILRRKLPRRFSPSGFFLGFFFKRIGPCGPVPSPPLEWTSFLSLVTAVLITAKGAESPDSPCIGVIGALVLILPSKTV